MSTDATDPAAARLAEVRAREQAATHGEWRNEPHTAAGRVWVQIGGRWGNADCEPLFNVRAHGSNPTAEDYRQRAADAAFIAHARTDVPALLGALETALALHRPDREDSDWCAYDAFSWPCREYREISAALLGMTTGAEEGADGVTISSLADEVRADRQQRGGSMNPTADCGGPRKPPGATEVWWCETHREFHGQAALLGEGTDG